MQRDVLDPERAAADRVGLVLVLLVARPQRQLVDEVEGHRPLPDAHLLRLELGRVVVPDLGSNSNFLLISITCCIFYCMINFVQGSLCFNQSHVSFQALFMTLSLNMLAVYGKIICLNYQIFIYL